MTTFQKYNILFWLIISVAFLTYGCNAPVSLDFEEEDDDFFNIINILWWTEIIPNYDEIRHCGYFDCRFTTNRTTINNSDTKALIFHGTKMKDDFPLPRLNHQLWVLFQEESPKSSPYLTDNNILKYFNLTSTFSRYSNFPLPTLHLQSYESLVTHKYLIPIGVKTKLRKFLAPIVYLQSICNTMSGRDEYVDELMNYIQIDSYGSCLNNKNLKASLKKNYLNTIHSQELYLLLAQYKFIITYENSVCHDYITEKLWRSLTVGSIPIYFGSPTIKDWLPNEKSAILISDFDSPEDLANFIKKLDKNDTEYNTYLEHKYSLTKPITNRLLINSLWNRHYRLETVFKDVGCFICDLLYGFHYREANNFTANNKYFDCQNEFYHPNMKKNVEKIQDNQWKLVLEMDQCKSHIIDDVFKENLNYTQEFVDKQLISTIFNQQCDIFKSEL